MGTDFGDYDGDGDLDLFVTNHELEAHTLFRNLGKGLFEDATFTSGVGPPTLPFVGFGAGFLDVDNDADLDLSIVNGHVMNSPEPLQAGREGSAAQPPVAKRGEGTFQGRSRQSGPGFAVENISRTLASGDIDNDGDLDLLVTNNASAADLLRNGGTSGNNSLLVRLVGTRSNRNAIGARMRLTAGGRNPGQRSECGIELSGSARSAHALRSRSRDGDRSPRDPVAEWSDGNRAEHRRESDRDDHRGQRRDVIGSRCKRQLGLR